MTATIAGIPVYNALVDDVDTGMLKISLVDEPAVMSNFVAFAPDKVTVKYAITDEEKRLVRGVVMRADFPIYRRDEKFGEYYIIYKADTIRQMAEKYLLESRQNNVNLMHEDGSDVEGVQMVQFFIKDTASGVNPTGFGDDIADGSLFGEFHVVNDDVWDAVKEGTYQGFSLEGVFNLVAEQDQDAVAEIADELEGKFRKTNSKKIMSKLKRIKDALANFAKVLAEFGAVTTDKGVLSWDGDEDIKVGLEVFVEDAEGNSVAAADGDYATEDGKVIVVADGKISEIKDAEIPEAMGKVSTDKGELSWDGEEDLKAGDAVFVEKDGERVAAEDGDYTTEDGKVIKVVDGKVAEITDPAAEVAARKEKKMSFFAKVRQAFEDSYEEKERKIAEAVVATLAEGVYCYLVEAGDSYAVFNVFDETDWEGKYIRYEVSFNEAGEVVLGASEEVKHAFVPVNEPNPSEPTNEELAAVKAENVSLKAEIANLRKLSGGEPAHVAFTTAGGAVKTGVKGLDNLGRIMAAE